jgi:hypothetical protein
MPLLPLKPMAQLRRGVVRVMEAQVHPLVVGKGILIWINLGIAATRGRAFASSIRTTPRLDWAIGFKGSKDTPVKADGSITVWGDSSYGGAGAPSGGGYTKIYSTGGAFVAVKADGSIKVWGSPYAGGTGAPSGRGYTKIYSNWGASSIRTTPRLDWAIGFKGSKDTPIWINLGSTLW